MADENHNKVRPGASGKQIMFVAAAIALACVIAVLAFNTEGLRNTAPGNDEVRTSMQSTDSMSARATAGPTSAAEEPVITGGLDPGLHPALDHISREEFIEARIAIAFYQKELADCAQCEFLHALTYHKEKRYELARPFFEKAIKMQDRYAPAHYFYGWCLYYLSELEGARAAFEKHLKMDALEGDSHYGIGLIDIDEGQLDDAEKRFRTSIELQENNPRRLREVAKAHARLGDIFALRDDLVEAKSQLFLATELWPGHYEAQFKLARVLYRLGEDEAAEAAMQKFELGRRRVEGAAPANQPDVSEDEP